MKRPLPNKYILREFLSLLLKQSIFLGTAMVLIHYSREYLVRHPLSDQTWIITSFSILLITICTLLSIKRNKCSNCKNILKTISAYCHNCAKPTQSSPNKAHEQRQELNEIEIRDYLKGAIASGSIKGFLTLFYILSFLIPLICSTIFDFRYILLMFPFLIITMFIIQPLNEVLWNRCPYCADETMNLYSKRAYKVCPYCSNCGNPLAENS